MRLALGLVLALASCTPVESPPHKLSLDARQSCVAGGGSVQMDGLKHGELCVTPAADAGKSCSKASDCSVLCEAETRSCVADDNPFGCYSYLDENGETLRICVD